MNHKRRHLTLAQIINAADSENQAALASFLEEHGDNAALALWDEAARRFAETEAKHARNEVLRESGQLTLDRFKTLEERVASIATEVATNLERLEQRETSAEQAFKNQRLEDSSGIKKCFQAFLVCVGVGLLLFTAITFWLAPHDRQSREQPQADQSLVTE